MVICLTSFYLNSIASLLLPYTGTQLVLYLDAASLAAHRDSQMCARIVSSARHRSSSRASLLFEGDPLHNDKEARENCSSSDDECEARQRPDNLAKAVRVLAILVESWRELLRQTVREATEWSLHVWEGAASNTRVVSVSRSGA